MTPREASEYHRQLASIVHAVGVRYRPGLSREDAEEMTADAMAAALHAAEAFDPEHPAGASLTTLATRYADLAARAWLRTRRRQPEEVSLDAVDDDGRAPVDTLADDRPDDVDADMEQGRRLELIKEIAEELPPGQRRAILGALAGQTIPAIARDAGISRGAVYESYEHAVKAVRREVARREHRQAAEAAYIAVMK